MEHSLQKYSLTLKHLLLESQTFDPEAPLGPLGPVGPMPPCTQENATLCKSAELSF